MSNNIKYQVLGLSLVWDVKKNFSDSRFSAVVGIHPRKAQITAPLARSAGGIKRKKITQSLIQSQLDLGLKQFLKPPSSVQTLEKKCTRGDERNKKD